MLNLQYLLGLHPWAAQVTASNLEYDFISREGSKREPPEPIAAIGRVVQPQIDFTISLQSNSDSLVENNLNRTQMLTLTLNSKSTRYKRQSSSVLNVASRDNIQLGRKLIFHTNSFPRVTGYLAARWLFDVFDPIPLKLTDSDLRHLLFLKLFFFCFSRL